MVVTVLVWRLFNFSLFRLLDVAALCNFVMTELVIKSLYLNLDENVGMY